MSVRASGVLLHPTSLPCRFGIGDLGPSAFRFVDLLAEAGQLYWQMLPVNPTDPRHGHSPYHCGSAFAGDPLWISPEILVEEGWIPAVRLEAAPTFPEGWVDFARVRPFKSALLDEAFRRHEKGWGGEAVERFARRSRWVEDFALFRVLGRLFDGPWHEWPSGLRDRQPAALEEAREKYAVPLRREVFFQYLFSQQWRSLRRHCRERGVQLVGDMPIYLPFHSADVWAHPGNYRLTEKKTPAGLSGVPPDYFSETGQLWGHPVYDWESMAEDGFDWWVRRIRHQMDLFDRVRIDHFRGWVAYWEVPPDADTAVDGRWVPVPGRQLLETLFRKCPRLDLIAEDLGTIGPDVRETMAAFDLPGMRVLQFAFGEDFPDGSFLPHRHVRNCVAYTGTHDNDTARGWFEEEAGPAQRGRLHRYIGRFVPPSGISWAMIRLAFSSVADTAVVPLQDLLGLGSSARMNRPAGSGGNWLWRAKAPVLPPSELRRLKETTRTFGRSP